MSGLYILDGHKIASGKKTAIAAPTNRELSGQRLLIIRTAKGGRVVGNITIGDPQPVNIKEFDDRAKQHNVRSIDRMRWWPGQKKLFIWPIEKYEPFHTPMDMEIPAGIGMKMDIELTTVTIIDVERVDDTFIYTTMETD